MTTELWANRHGHSLKAIHRTPVGQERVFQSHGSLQNSDKRAHKTEKIAVLMD